MIDACCLQDGEEKVLGHCGWKEGDICCGGLEKTLSWCCGSYGEGAVRKGGGSKKGK